jgi:hypothetical protein
VTHLVKAGGRLIELLWAFVLILVSTATLLAPLLGFVAVFWFAGMISAWLVIPILGLVQTQWFRDWAFRSHRYAYRLAAQLWVPFLHHYKYEPHTLRPLAEKDEPK